MTTFSPITDHRAHIRGPMTGPAVIAARPAAGPSHLVVGRRRAPALVEPPPPPPRPRPRPVDLW